jgi:hypothetical protein
VQVVSTELPLGRSQLLEVVDMLEDIRQRLTHVHFSAQPEPFLTQHTP